MSKRLVLRLTAAVEIEVEDDFPVTHTEIEKAADWRANNYNDGRYPFSTELMQDGAESLARHALDYAVSDHYGARVERMFGRTNDHWGAKAKLEARALKKTHVNRVHDLEVSATDQPEPVGGRYTYDPHIVLCRKDMAEDGTPGAYELATRTVFAGREVAELYASAIARSREPIVIELPLTELRVGEARGTLEYWQPRRHD